MEAGSPDPEKPARDLLWAYHAQTILACGLLVASVAGAATYGIWRLYAAQIASEAGEHRTANTLLRLTTQTFFEKYVAIARSLAVNPDLSGPTRNATEPMEILTSRISDAQARVRSQREHIQTWLRTEFGPPEAIPAPSKNARTVAVYRVTRGLPLRLASGKPMVPSRRLLFEQIRRSDNSILSIAELDSSDRILFLVPYDTQISLDAFNLSNNLHYVVSNDPNNVAIGRSPFSILRRSVSFLARGNHASGKFHILITVDTDSLALALARIISSKMTLYDPESHVLLATRDLEPSLKPCLSSDPTSLRTFMQFLLHRCALTETVHLSYPLEGLTYSMLFASSYRLPVSIFTSVLLLIYTVCGFLFMFLLGRFRYSYRAAIATHYRLAMLKQRHSGDISLLYDKLTAEAKHLAHSYTNSVVALRASLAQAKPLDTEIRLNTIIHDLTAYTLKLSKDLVVSSFANANIDGFAIAPEVIRPTYLRGTLLQAMGQYREKFKALTIEVSAAFAQEEPFINFGYTTLASVASNLLSNAADAQASDVAIVVSRENEYAVIQFLDNGTGISGDPSRVFTGWTTKGEGHGKGLQGCKAQVKKEGGDLVCRGSQPEQTVFELRARLQPTPVWFIDKVRLKSKSVVVVVDDEPGVDELWQRAFEAGFQNTNLPEDALPRFIKLNSPDDLISNARNALKEGTVFLVDYQFGEGSTRNGIQLIEELDLRDRAILVTGHSDEQPVINEVIKKGLKLLSKTYMYSVGFSIEMGGDNETDSNTWYLSYARLRLAA